MKSLMWQKRMIDDAHLLEISNRVPMIVTLEVFKVSNSDNRPYWNAHGFFSVCK